MSLRQLVTGFTINRSDLAMFARTALPVRFRNIPRMPLGIGN